MRAYPASKLTISLCLAALLSLETAAFLRDKHLWPFVSFNMYCDFRPTRSTAARFEGTLTDGRLQPVPPQEYLPFLKPNDFHLAITALIAADRPRLAGVVRELKERFNRKARSEGRRELRSLRAYLLEWRIEDPAAQTERKLERKELLVEL